MTLVKKLTLLLGVVMAAAALAGPATASAYSNWTVTNSESELAYTELEGNYRFTPTFASQMPAWGSFECPVKMFMYVEDNASEAMIGDPEITNPQNCGGTGHWTGCQLDEVAFVFGGNWLTPSALVESYEHKAYLTGCKVPWTAAELEEVDMQPTVNAEGELVSIHLSGTSYVGGGAEYEFGTFTISDELPEGELGVIGLE